MLHTFIKKNYYSENFSVFFEIICRIKKSYYYVTEIRKSITRVFSEVMNRNVMWKSR